MTTYLSIHTFPSTSFHPHLSCTPSLQAPGSLPGPEFIRTGPALFCACSFLLWLAATLAARLGRRHMKHAAPQHQRRVWGLWISTALLAALVAFLLIATLL